MNENKRKIFLAIICLISLLSTHQFFDVCIRFSFLFNNIQFNITKSVFIYMIFVFFISLTSYFSIFYNWKLLEKKRRNLENDLLDDNESSPKKEFELLNYFYLIFSLLIIYLGVFLIIKPLQEEYPIENLPNGIMPYFVVFLITGLGIILLIDGLKIKLGKTDNK